MSTSILLPQDFSARSFFEKYLTADAKNDGIEASKAYTQLVLQHNDIKITESTRMMMLLKLALVSNISLRMDLEFRLNDEGSSYVMTPRIRKPYLQVSTWLKIQVGSSSTRSRTYLQRDLPHSTYQEQVWIREDAHMGDPGDPCDTDGLLIKRLNQVFSREINKEFLVCPEIRYHGEIVFRKVWPKAKGCNRCPKAFGCILNNQVAEWQYA